MNHISEIANTSILDERLKLIHAGYALAEKNVENWMFIPSVWSVLTVLSLYTFLVWYLPKYMEHREPYSLEKLIRCYNVAQIIMNIALVNMYLNIMKDEAFTKFWSHICYPIGMTRHFEVPMLIEALHFGYYYHINKIIDFSETIFFALRKKNSQITKLHIFHHIAIYLTSWAFVIHAREEMTTVFAVLNSFVHVVMYFYYFLSSLGPGIQKYLWWKRYITRLQLLQFVTCLIIATTMKLNGCVGKKYFYELIFFIVIIFLILFLNFHRYTYKNKKTD